MAKAIINGNEIFGNVHMGEGGGSAPIFSETVLADNSSKASSFTLSDSMSNYDFIVFKCLNSSSSLETEFITTPTHLAQMFTLTNNGILFNEPNSNQYCDYKVNGNTFTRYGQRNVDVVEVRGLKCTNKTVSETVIYIASALSSTANTISGTGFFDYDLLFFSGNASAWDDTAISMTPYKKDIFGVYKVCHYLQVYNAYYPIYITDIEMSSARYLCVTGIKFT